MVNEAHTQKKHKHPEGTSARKKADGKRQHVHNGNLLTLRITDLWGIVIIYRLRVLMKPSWPAARFAWSCQTEHQQYELEWMWGLCILNLNRFVEWWYFVPGDLQHLDDWYNIWTRAAAAAILHPTQYRIEDSHVKLSSEDPQLNDHPVPSTDFLLPMACVGDLLMVWDFCSLFSKALLLSPFTLEELEKSLDYKEGEAPLLLEINFALLCIALTDPILRDEFCHRRKRRSEVRS